MSGGVGPCCGSGEPRTGNQTWAPGLAGLLFLLDSNTYFPVLFVANRGFMVSLFFGLLCLFEHHRWRSGKGLVSCVLSALFLALALFANEGGASTFAFILAYALVLEHGSFRSRVMTILPSVLVIVVWRCIYKLSGFGIYDVGLYIDPANEPLEFGRVVVPRALVMLGGQIWGLAPDFLVAASPAWQPKLTAGFSLIGVAGWMIFLPWARRDKTAAFWLTGMLLGAIPAATVTPLSKNLGFVAVGAYGLIASFIAGLLARPGRMPPWPAYRILAWICCVALLLCHVAVPIAARVYMAQAQAPALQMMDDLANVGDSPDAEQNDVILVNVPCTILLAYAPNYKAYHHRPLPRTIRGLVPGCTGFEVQRIDDRTLVIQSKGQNIFCCDHVGPFDVAYTARAFNLQLGRPKCKKGDRYDLGGLTVEVLESDASGLASRVTFRFDKSLDSAGFRWLRFEWKDACYEPFEIPTVGGRVSLSGPAK